MTGQTIPPESRAFPGHAALPWLTGAGVYALLMLMAGRLLNDPDSYWHLVMGRWIVVNGAFPHTDPFSFTFNGEPWIAKEWLSQILFAAAYEAGGWTGVAALAAAAVALAFALLMRALLQRLEPVPALVLVLAALVLASPHLVARPHVLAMPAMVALVAGLVRAADAGRAPSWWLLPLMTLWANLHGGFTLGLLLIAPLAAEAFFTRKPWVRWVLFGIAATIAACITPYGPESILITGRILGLGEALAIIVEWRPQDFGTLGPFELLLLGGLAFALWRGLVLPPWRIAILIGLLHLALAHVRSAENLGLLAPLVIAAPLARQIGGGAMPANPSKALAPGLIAALAALTLVIGRVLPPQPDPAITPAAAVAALQKAQPGPVFNDYEFGGYLVHAGIAPFIDGRTELYGGDFMVRHHRAITLEALPDLLRIFDEYKIGATLLHPSRPAVALLNRLPEWERLYADNVAVVHVRKGGPLLDHGTRTGALFPSWQISKASTAIR